MHTTLTQAAHDAALLPADFKLLPASSFLTSNGYPSRSIFSPDGKIEIQVIQNGQTVAANMGGGVQFQLFNHGTSFCAKFIMATAGVLAGLGNGYSGGQAAALPIQTITNYGVNSPADFSNADNAMVISGQFFSWVDLNLQNIHCQPFNWTVVACAVGH